MQRKIIYLKSQGKRVLLICFLLFFIPFVTLFFIAGYKSSKLRQQSYLDLAKEFNNQVDTNLSQIFNSIHRISYIHTQDYKVEKILAQTSEHKDINYVNNLIYMNNLINNLTQINPEIYGITFISGDGEFYSNINNSNIDKDFINSQIDALNKNNSSSLLLSRVSKNTIFNNTEVLCSLNRLTNIHQETVGYLWIDINFQTIQSIVTMEPTQNSDLLLASCEEIICSSGETDNDISRITKGVFSSLDGELLKKRKEFTQIVAVNHTKYICLAKPATYMDAFIIQYLPYSSPLEQTFSAQGISLLCCLILLLLVIFVINRLSCKIFMPIDKLFHAMKDIEEGEFPQIQTDKSVYEIDLIIQRFNEMSANLKEAVKLNYITKLNQKRVQLKMLQSQINPHFIYNTLNLISSLAIINGVEDISSISERLSEILRYNVKKGDVVLLKEEILQIENYIYIQKVRFVNHFTEEIHIDPELLECKILKFLLQPLVENCIHHSLELMSSGGLLKITGKKAGNLIYLSVSDNGCGMPPEVLKHLNQQLSTNFPPSFSSSEKSIGIQNVYSRIKTFYGENYTLEIESELNKGTRFQMILPIDLL